MDPTVTSAANQLLQADRVLGPLIVILGAALLGMAWAYKKARDKIDDLNEKRITESQTMTKVTADSTHVLELLTETVKNSTRGGAA